MAENRGSFNATVSAIADAFGDPTRRGIYLLVRDHPDGLTAAQVAQHFSVHPNVARHHLDKLAAGGYVEVAAHRTQGAGAGRPSKRYQPVAVDESAVPVRVDDLLLSLLGRALQVLPPDQVETMAEEVGNEFGRSIAAGMTGPDDSGHRSLRAAIDSIADALTAQGFAAHAEQRDDQLRIVNHNCPFGDMAVQHPVICAVDRGMVRGMLAALHGEHQTTTQCSIAKGDDVCATLL